jgi:hypothetical protein
VVVKFYIANTLIAILSKDTSFTPKTAISGFPTIRPGFNLSTTASPSLVYYGNAYTATHLSVSGVDVDASEFLRSTVSVPTTTKFQVQTNDGIEIGTAANATLNITGTEFRITSTWNGTDTVFYNKVSGTNTKVLTLSGTTGKVLLTGDPTAALGAATKQYVDQANTDQGSSVGTRILASNSSMKTYVDAGNVSMKSYVDTRAVLRDAGGNTTVSGNVILTGNIIPSANATATTGYSLGNISLWYSNVWAYTFRGVSSTAQYADLAEKYVTDQEYPIGTVVQVGGTAEVTACSLNGIAIGVVSAHPAYLMNEAAPGQAIALKGRVPVLISGTVNKGDGLTAGPNGHAITTYSEANTPYTDPTYTPYIARRFAVSLESNDDPGSKLVECVIL